MAKYRKIPVEIEAVKFTNETKDKVYIWARSIQGNVYHDWKEGKPILKIPTLEGEMECSLNDYIIVEPFPTDWRKLYPCKPSIFKKTYEELFTYQNDEAGHKALILIRKYEMWKTKFKPQRQVIIWILPTLTILFGLAVIAWYVLVRF